MSRSDMIGSVIDRINKVIDRFSASNTTSKALHMGALLLAFNAMSMVAASVAAAQTADVRPIKIVAFGDSLSAGFQLAPSAAFPQVLGKALAAKGYNVDVINASVSGDTTAAGRDRLDWSMPPDADAVILELGANDALRALDPAKARANIEAIIATLKARKIDVLLGGMLAPRSLGEPYTKAFDAIYPELAAKYTDNWKAHELHSVEYQFPVPATNDGTEPSPMVARRRTHAR